MIEPQNEKLSPEHIDLEARFIGEGDLSESVEQADSPEIAHEKTRAQNDAVYAHILSKVKTQDQLNPTAVKQDAQTLEQLNDSESQITHLLDIAMTKGVVHAVKVAQHTNDFYVLDQLHDRMRAEDFYQALVTKGLIDR